MIGIIPTSRRGRSVTTLRVIARVSTPLRPGTPCSAGAAVDVAGELVEQDDQGELTLGGGPALEVVVVPAGHPLDVRAELGGNLGVQRRVAAEPASAVGWEGVVERQPLPRPKPEV